MSTTYFDRLGTPIAYSDDEIHIYTFDGMPVAYLASESIYSYSGKHLGRFRDGLVRDNQGDVVFFTDQASGGPVKPMKQLRPLKGLKQLRPLKSVKELKPLVPLNRLSWSQVSGRDFFFT